MLPSAKIYIFLLNKLKPPKTLQIQRPKWSFIKPHLLMIRFTAMNLNEVVNLNQSHPRLSIEIA